MRRAPGRTGTDERRSGAPPGVVWNADFLIDTSVLSWAAHGRHFYDRLAVQVYPCRIMKGYA